MIIFEIHVWSYVLTCVYKSIYSTIIYGLNSRKFWAFMATIGTVLNSKSWCKQQETHRLSFTRNHIDSQIIEKRTYWRVISNTLKSRNIKVIRLWGIIHRHSIIMQLTTYIMYLKWWVKDENIVRHAPHPQNRINAKTVKKKPKFTNSISREQTMNFCWELLLCKSYLKGQILCKSTWSLRKTCPSLRIELLS